METNENESSNRTFSADYVRELREEAKSYRLQVEEERQKRKSLQEELATAQQQTKQAQDAASKASAEVEAKVAEYAKQQALESYKSDLKFEALKAGILDPEIVQMISIDPLKPVSDAIKEFAEAKPFLFSSAVKSTVPTSPEPSRKPAVKNIDAMSAAERADDLESLLK